MKFTTTLIAVAAAVLIVLPASAQDIKIIDTVELSGAGAVSGTNWQRGVDLAVKEINAAGGVLGRKIAVEHYDNQSNPGTARAMVAKALDQEPQLLLGPIFSGDVMVTMAAAQQAEIPQIVGGEAAAITRQGNPYVFRSSLSQAAAMPKLANYLANEMKVHSLAVVWVNNDFGKGGRDAMLEEMKKRDITLAADISTESGQLDFSSAVSAAMKSNADALFSYTNEEESARLLRELRKQGYSKPIFGETVLISQKVIELAGGAAEGVKGHVGLTTEAPNPLIRDMVAKFEKAYGEKPDHNGIKGYYAVYLFKAVSEKNGKIDPKLFAKSIPGIRLSAKDYPGILLDIAYNQKGDIDRESYLVEVKDGKQAIIATLPMAGVENLK